MRVWLNGSMVDPDRAVVPVNDHGLTVGDGAFETMKTIGGEPIAISRHLKRLARTLEAMEIEMPDVDTLRGAIAETLAELTEAEQAEKTRVRVTVTSGVGALGSGAPTGPPSVFVVAVPLTPRAEPTAITVPWTRNERGALAGLKTTSYAENVLALRAAKRAGAREAIFANTIGNLCEGTGTNIFVVIDDQCSTPPLSSGCLAGVTRELVVELGDIQEVDLPLDVLASADEIFLTSSTRDVQGIEQMDGRTLDVGPVTATLAERFDALIAATTDP